MQQDHRQTRIEAEMPLDMARIRVVHNVWDEPIDITGMAHTHHVELTLLPNSENARGCFCDDWGSHRFEPMGDVFLLPADRRVRARSDCRQQNSVMCDFAPDAVETWLEHNLEHARRLLASGMSVKAVAYTTGFSAPSNFTAAFRRDTGETPGQYQRRITSTGTVAGSRRRLH